MESQASSMASAFRYILTGLYIGITLLFVGVWLQTPATTSGFFNYYSNILCVIPMLGAVFAWIVLANNRQLINDPYRRAGTIFALGLFLWSLGGVIWMYYNFNLGTNTPYPSWAD